MGLATRHAAIVVVIALATSFCFAQSPRSSGQSSSKPHAKARGNAAPETGSSSDGVYRNPSLNLSYKIPFGWVDRTEDMREGSEMGKSLLLLSVFERPPEAKVDGVNSAVVIAAENVSSYPGLKTADDYFGPLTEMAAGKGFKIVNQPYEFPLGTKTLVRGDFSKESGSMTMKQTSLVFLQKNWIVSCTFIGGSDDEIQELVEHLTFGTAATPRRPAK
jgi:hypothetical protein